MKPLAAAAILFNLLFSLGCSASPAELTPEEQTLAKTAKVDATVARQARSMGTSIERWMAQTPEFDEVPADGIVVNTAPGKGDDVIARLRSTLAGTPYRAYLRENAFGHGPDKIVVAAVDDAGYLAAVRPDGINYDLDHERVMARYNPWRERYGLKLVGAGGDWIDAEITIPPKDWLAFAKEVYEFCPDIVDQGTGDVEKLAEEMQKTRHLYLWWD